MCVAIYKPENVKTPNLETLEKCWNANPDGAGFAMISDNSKYAISIHKGFMDWEDFVKAYYQYKLADYQGRLLIHFRVATHGGVSKGNTHPFPLTSDIKLLKSQNTLCNFALIHNGMLPITPSQKNISDTMELCKKLANGKFYNSIPQIADLLNDLIGSNKIAIMTKDDVFLAGNWELVDDVYFSNLNWDYYFDDYFLTPIEKEYLKHGICPNCDDILIKDDKEYFFPMCNSFWEV